MGSCSLSAQSRAAAAIYMLLYIYADILSCLLSGSWSLSLSWGLVVGIERLEGGWQGKE